MTEETCICFIRLPIRVERNIGYHIVDGNGIVIAGTDSKALAEAMAEAAANEVCRVHNVPVASLKDEK